MLFTPTDALSNDFPAVNLAEVQDMSKKDIPANGAYARGKFSIVFRFDGKPETEWKYKTKALRDADYTAAVEASQPA